MSIREHLPRFCCMLIFLVLLTTSFLSAQRLTGKIVGVVTDEKGIPLPGVTLEISSPALMGGVHYLVTSEKGAYRLMNCPPGIYKILCKLEGFQTVERENLRVLLGGTITENIVLKQLALEELVTVTAESPVVDVTKSSMTINYDKSQLEKLPFGRFSFLDIVKHAPGFAYRTGITEYMVSAYGAGAEENAWYIDGIDLSNPEEGTAYLWITSDMFEALEISGTGAPAEYGNFTGAVVNMVTKSGGNKLSGSLSYYGQFDKLTGDNNPDKDKWTSYNRDKLSDIAFTLGGPIIKDRLWFFGVYRRLVDLESFWQVAPDFPIENRQNEQFFKLSSQISSKHKLVLSFYRLYRHLMLEWPDPFNEKETICDQWGPAYSWNFFYTFFINDNTYFDLKYSRWYSPYRNMPKWGDVDSPIHYDLATGVSSNGPWWPWEWIPERNQVNISFTHYAENFIGEHDFKFGIQYNMGATESWGGYGGGKLYLDYMGAPYLMYAQNIWRYGGTVQNAGAFFDDSWKINERLVVNIGLRFDNHNASIPSFTIMDGWRETSEKEESIDDLFVWNSFSPRIGIAFQLTSDQKTLLTASFGRYYNYPYTGNWFWPGPNAPDKYAYQWNGIDWDLWQEIPGEMGYTVDPNIKNPYSDQFSIGVEREISRNCSIGVTFLYKNSKDSIGYKNVAGIYEQVRRVSPDNNKTYTVFNQLNPGENDYWLTNPEGWDQTYKGLILNFNKRYSNNWLLNASLVWSKAEGLNLTSGGGGIHATVWHAGQFGKDPNDLINAKGPLNTDRTWVLKLSAGYDFPWNIFASMNFIYQTGRPRLTYVRIYNLDQTPFSSISIIADTRGTERFNSQYQLDFRIQKTFNLYKSFKFHAFIDVFNLLNNNTHLEFYTHNLWQANYSVPSQILRPRRAQIGLKLEF